MANVLLYVVISLEGKTEEFVLCEWIFLSRKVRPLTHDYRVISSQTTKLFLVWLDNLKEVCVVLEYIISQKKVVDLWLVPV